MNRREDGTFDAVESDYFPKIFPPLLKEKYKIMLGSEDLGGWSKVYDSHDTQGHLHERTFRVFRELFTEDQHMTRLTQEQFSAVKDKLEGTEGVSNEDLAEIFEKTAPSGTMDLQDFYDAIEGVAEKVGKQPNEIVKN